MEQKARIYHQGVVINNRVGIQVKEHIPLKRSGAVQEHGGICGLDPVFREVGACIIAVGNVVNAVFISVLAAVLVKYFVSVRVYFVRKLHPNGRLL